MQRRTMAGSGLTKNQRRRLKKRAQRQAEANGVKTEPVGAAAVASSSSNGSSGPTEDAAPDVEVEYVSADLSKELALPQDDPAYEEMMRVFGKFSSAEELCGATDNEVRPLPRAQDIYLSVLVGPTHVCVSIYLGREGRREEGEG